MRGRRHHGAAATALKLGHIRRMFPATRICTDRTVQQEPAGRNPACSGSATSPTGAPSGPRRRRAPPYPVNGTASRAQRSGTIRRQPWCASPSGRSLEIGIRHPVSEVDDRNGGGAPTGVTRVLTSRPIGMLATRARWWRPAQSGRLRSSWHAGIEVRTKSKAGHRARSAAGPRSSPEPRPCSARRHPRKPGLIDVAVGPEFRFDYAETESGSPARASRPATQQKRANMGFSQQHLGRRAGTSTYVVVLATSWVCASDEPPRGRDQRCGLARAGADCLDP